MILLPINRTNRLVLFTEPRLIMNHLRFQGIKKSGTMTDAAIHASFSTGVCHFEPVAQILGKFLSKLDNRLAVV